MYVANKHTWAGSKAEDGVPAVDEITRHIKEYVMQVVNETCNSVGCVGIVVERKFSGGEDEEIAVSYDIGELYCHEEGGMYVGDAD